MVPKVSQFLFVPAIVLASLALSAQDKEDLVAFIGQEKADALEHSIRSFDSFLEANYPEGEIQHKTIQFLSDYESWLENEGYENENDDSWRIDKMAAGDLIDDLEQSGLRRDIWLYTYEKDEPGPIVMAYLDSVRKEMENQSQRGQKIVFREIDSIDGLLEIPPATEEQIDKETEQINRRVSATNSALDAIIAKFGKEKLVVFLTGIAIRVGGVSPQLSLSAMLDKQDEIDFDEYYTKVYLVKEYYYPLLYSVARR